MVMFPIVKHWMRGDWEGEPPGRARKCQAEWSIGSRGIPLLGHRVFDRRGACYFTLEKESIPYAICKNIEDYDCSITGW
jgi:hypothetical protein